MANHVLLLGAGFSRNWGGWLVDEVLEYLLSCTEIQTDVRELLLRKKFSNGNFEDALAELQAEDSKHPSAHTKQRLGMFQSALVGMFNLMDQGFGGVDFEFNENKLYKNPAHKISTFLARFDAIFTLNQDLLLERHYLQAVGGRWKGFQIPGMKPTLQNSPAPNPTHPGPAGRWEPAMDRLAVQPTLQPYFKLHGSSNWIDSNGAILIMGGGKGEAIERHPVLSFYQTQFANYLSRPDTRLMTIGYSFRDDHINSKIIGAAKKWRPDGKQWCLFLVDPSGLDVLDLRCGPKAPIANASAEMKELAPYVSGASRRSLGDTFGGDYVEHTKLMKFFD